ncbi:hypothetical protein BD770DRAFT_389921 [Pilaira anomala]|nr:hypothetical protein BD770DRAFT_389921 [Pilaira anomala]
MSDDKENIEEEINESRERTNKRVRQFVQIPFEREAEHQVAVLKEKSENDKSGLSASSSSSSSSDSSISSNLEDDKVYVNGCSASIGTIIKREALHLRQRYHSLDIQDKAILSLGLNSILDLSFSKLDAQGKLFERSQWKQLRDRYPPKKYNVDYYTHLLKPLSSIRGIYDRKKSSPPPPSKNLFGNNS